MAKITEEHIPLIYSTAQDVYEGNISIQQGVNILQEEVSMNSNSASMYIEALTHMLRAKEYARTINAYSTKYYLDRITDDYGYSGLKNALLSLHKHILYYEKLTGTTAKKNREIYDDYLEKYFAKNADQELKEEDIIIAYQNEDREHLIRELYNSLGEIENEKVNRVVSGYKRNTKVIALIKILRGFKCQLCGWSYRKSDGSYYIEAAHIIPKRDRGNEAPNNILLLCPNHHKEFDYGNFEIVKQDKNVVHIILNDKDHKINVTE